MFIATTAKPTTQLRRGEMWANIHEQVTNISLLRSLGEILITSDL